MKTAELIFDGGSIGNPGRSYGSFRWRLASGRLSKPVRKNFGDGTNNQAEYRALIAGLETLLFELSSNGTDSAQIDLVIRGDSRLVLKQLAGEWKIKNSTLRKLHATASTLLDEFGSVRLVHQTRSETVQALGH